MRKVRDAMERVNQRSTRRGRRVSPSSGSRRRKSCSITTWVPVAVGVIRHVDAHATGDAAGVEEMQSQLVRVAVIGPLLGTPGDRHWQWTEPSDGDHPGHKVSIAQAPFHRDAAVVRQHLRPPRDIPGEGMDPTAEGRAS